MFNMNLKRECMYLGVKYIVVDVLDNDLLLVVNQADIESGKYPLQTFVVPYEESKRLT